MAIDIGDPGPIDPEFADPGLLPQYMWELDRIRDTMQMDNLRRDNLWLEIHQLELRWGRRFW